MTMENTSSYRDVMFDGQADLDWLRQGWRGLRLYGRRAKAAIEAGDIAHKAVMIHRADQLLNVMSGILMTDQEARLGNALMTIYTALRFTLLRANTENDSAALDDLEAALSILDRNMNKRPESAIAA
jgi:flagellar biosynthetic protein FliS